MKYHTLRINKGFAITPCEIFHDLDPRRMYIYDKGQSVLSLCGLAWESAY
jgi:hypothetical protein